MSTTWVDNLFAALIVRPNVEHQEPARSESTSIPIDVRISVYPMGDNHPLVSSFGAFEHEPLWDELIRVMNESRREIAAQELEELGG